MTTLRNPLRRFGTSQTERLIAAIMPDTLKLDDRDIKDMLSFARRYADSLTFYNEENQADGNWACFWDVEPLVVLAATASLNTEAIALDYKKAERAYLKAKLDFNDPNCEVDESPQYLRCLVRLIYSLAKNIEEIHRKLPDTSKLDVFKCQIRNIITQNFRGDREELEKALNRLIQFDKGEEALCPDELPKPKNWTLLDDYKIFIAAPHWHLTVEEFHCLLPEDMEADNILSILRGVFLQFLRAMQQIIRLANENFDRLIGDTTIAHEPHIALFITFLRLFSHVQDFMNGLPKRHLDYFYETILCLHRRPEQADSVNVIFELAKDFHQVVIEKGTLLNGGKDALGKDRMYRTVEEWVVNAAQVVEIKNTYVRITKEKKPDGTDGTDGEELAEIFAEPAADKVDSIKEPFLNPTDTAWRGVGDYYVANTEGGAKGNLKADFGFAIASPMLLLKEGKRRVTLTFTCFGDGNTDNAKKANAAAVIAKINNDHFDFFWSTKEDWFQHPYFENFSGTAPNVEQVSAIGNELKIVLVLKHDAPAIVPFKDAAKAHLKSDLPILKILLKEIAKSFAVKFEALLSDMTRFFKGIEKLRNIDPNNTPIFRDTQIRLNFLANLAVESQVLKATHFTELMAWSGLLNSFQTRIDSQNTTRTQDIQAITNFLVPLETSAATYQTGRLANKEILLYMQNLKPTVDTLQTQLALPTVLTGRMSVATALSLRTDIDTAIATDTQQSGLEASNLASAKTDLPTNWADETQAINDALTAVKTDLDTLDTRLGTATTTFTQAVSLAQQIQTKLTALSNTIKVGNKPSVTACIGHLKTVQDKLAERQRSNTQNQTLLSNLSTELTTIVSQAKTERSNIQSGDNTSAVGIELARLVTEFNTKPQTINAAPTFFQTYEPVLFKTKTYLATLPSAILGTEGGQLINKTNELLSIIKTDGIRLEQTQLQLNLTKTQLSRITTLNNPQIAPRLTALRATLTTMAQQAESNFSEKATELAGLRTSLQAIQTDLEEATLEKTEIFKELYQLNLAIGLLGLSTDQTAELSAFQNSLKTELESKGVVLALLKVRTADMPFSNKITSTHVGKLGFYMSKVTALPNDVESVYYAFQRIKISAIKIEANVVDLTDLSIRTNQGEFNGKQEFLPFGASPKIGNALVLGNAEVKQKPVSKINLNLDWSGMPLSGYYPPSSPISLKSYFYEQGELRDKANSNHLLEESGILKSLLTLDPLLGDAPQIQTLAFPLEIDDFLGLQLEAAKTDVFGHDAFVVALGNMITVKDNVVNKTDAPNPPYTPKIRSLKLDYDASDTLLFDGKKKGHQFFYITPFDGFKELDLDKAATGGQVVPFYNFGKPEFNKPNQDFVFADAHSGYGNLYVGLKDLRSGQNLSLLIQVRDGSEQNSEVEAPSVAWSYLSADNEWKPFVADQILEDRTLGLKTSGIIQFVIPRDAVKESTMLNPALHWLRASVIETATTKAAAFPEIVAIRAQGILARFANNANDLTHLATVLPKESIKKLAVNDFRVKKIEQPFASFDGRLPEEGMEFYRRVSERLLHRNRAVRMEDYEKLILERYPDIQRALCFNHARFTEGGGIMPVAPGCVTIVVVPSLENRNFFNRAQPLVPVGRRLEIEAWLRTLTNLFTAQAGALRVVNPVYESLIVSGSVVFNEKLDPSVYRQKLNTDLKEYLAPWLASDKAQIVFGKPLAQSRILHFIETRDYVDVVSKFEVVGGKAFGDEIKPSFTHGILTTHLFTSRSDDKVEHNFEPELKNLICHKPLKTNK